MGRNLISGVKERKWLNKEEIFILISIFLFSSFFGFVYETLLRLAKGHGLKNGGFMYGPFLPIYGFGAIALILVFSHLRVNKNNIFKVFTLSFLLTTVVELIGSYLVDFFVGDFATLWNYYKRPYNYQGRICLIASIVFGVFGTFLICCVYPTFEKIYDNKKYNNKYEIFLFLIFILFLFDFFLHITIGSNYLIK